MAWDGSRAEFPKEHLLDKAAETAEVMSGFPLPDEVSTDFQLVCEMSHEAGWSGRPDQLGARSAVFEKGQRFRLVVATPAGVTLQQGPAEREAAGD